jgi:hypothetical protein
MAQIHQSGLISISWLLTIFASATSAHEFTDAGFDRDPDGRDQCLHFVYNRFMAAETTTVRVRRPDSERLQSLAKARQIAVVDVVHAAIDALERQEFLRGLNADYQQLRNDPAMWEQYLAERREWDALA